MTIHELAEAYRRGETTPSAVAEAHLARIAALDAKVGAFLTVTRERALAAAAAAGARRGAGAPPAHPVGPRPRARRLLGRLGGGRGGRAGGGGARHRHGRLGPPARRVLRRRRPQAHLRARLALRAPRPPPPPPPRPPA